MNKKETIMKEVEDRFEYFDKDGYDEEFLSTTSAENITDLIIKHEKDILKEFVDYVIKQHTTKDGRKLVIFDEVLLKNLDNFINERENG